MRLGQEIKSEGNAPHMAEQLFWLGPTGITFR
jgi:hypothetical protein